MNSALDPSGTRSSGGVTDVLPRLQAGQQEGSAVARAVRFMHAEALRIARAQHRRRGSPDGVTGASDLANSQVAEIWQNPTAELSNVATTDDLKRVLHRMLVDRWIDRRRKAQAKKRGGGKVIAAGGLADDDDSDPLDRYAHQLGEVEPPNEAEIAADIADLIEVFPDGSQERQVIDLLLQGYTQAEIGDRIGLSRDAVGRRIRQTIAPAIARLHKLEPPA